MSTKSLAAGKHGNALDIPRVALARPVSSLSVTPSISACGLERIFSTSLAGLGGSLGLSSCLSAGSPVKPCSVLIALLPHHPRRVDCPVHFRPQSPLRVAPGSGAGASHHPFRHKS